MRRSTGQAVVSGGSGAALHLAASKLATRAPRSSRKANPSAKAVFDGSAWISLKMKSYLPLEESHRSRSWISRARLLPTGIRIHLMALEDGGGVFVQSLLLFLMPKFLVLILILSIYHYSQSLAQVLLAKLHCLLFL
jgi:hypothetical protein